MKTVNIGGVSVEGSGDIKIEPIEIKNNKTGYQHSYAGLKQRNKNNGRDERRC